MKKTLTLCSAVLVAVVATALSGAADSTHSGSSAPLTPMPQELETRFALSALPPHLRNAAAVYLLDPRTGYVVGRKGANQFSCLVTRTYWFKEDFRDDVYDASCFDAEGVRNNLKVWMDTAGLRAQGRSAADVKKEIARRFREHIYRAPTRFGLSYMIAPLMRTYTNTGDDDNRDVMTMTYPHVMYYAPGVTDADIGANPLPTPFPTVLLPGPHGFVIQPLGEVERARVLAENRELLDALCRYRDVLCLKEARGR